MSSAGVDLPERRSNVTVVVDPFIGRHLGPHQRDGVRFMYECVVGLRRGAPRVRSTGMSPRARDGHGQDAAGDRAAVDALEAGPDCGEAGGEEGCHRVSRVARGESWGGEIKKWLNDTRLEPLLVEGGEGADSKQNRGGLCPTSGGTASW